MPALAPTSSPAAPRLVARVAAALLAGALVACGPAGDADGVGDGPAVRHVVLVVLDTTAAHHLGCQGGHPEASPVLDDLAARGVRFEEARSNTTWTLPSSASLFSGRWPETHGVVTAQHGLPDDLPLVTETFADAGWRVGHLTQMVFSSARHGFDRGVETYAYFGQRTRNDDLRQALDDWFAAADERPSLLSVHMRRPHSPYQPDEVFRAPFEAGCPLADGRADAELAFIDSAEDPDPDAAEREHLLHLYRGNLREADTHLGELVARLGDALERDTLLVVTSDHGEGLGEHGDYGHGPELYGEHVRIPLIVVGPGLGPAVVDAPVSTVDVAPTLYELAGVAPPGPFDGRSLAALLAGSEDDGLGPGVVPLSGRRYPGETAQVGAVAGGWKLVRAPDGALRLHALADDPDERHPRPLEDAPPELRAALERVVEALAAWRPAPPGVRAAPLDPELEADLRALGYLK